MDSGNSSGSLQSSSGGEDEYDSRAGQESSFSSAAFMINQNQNNHVGLGLGSFTSKSTSAATTSNSFANSHTLPPQQQRHHKNTHMLDPLSNCLDPMERSPSLPNPNALLNLDMIMWSKPASRSEANPADLGSLFIPCSSSSQQQQQNHHAFLLSGQCQTTRDSSSGGGASFLAPPHDDSSQEGGQGGGSRGLLLVSAGAANNNDQPHSTNMVRNPKKRSRASRRAPTTVLTTDTTNFRAMVQEFTGIPAHPFTSASPFPRTRFDLFASAPAGATSSRLLDPSPVVVPPYLLRPFAQKLHHHHPFPPSSNSMVESLLASNGSTNSVTNSTSINYLLSSPSDHLGLLKHPPLNLNMNNNSNPILNFQNILQPPPKYHIGNPPPSLVASKTQPSLEIPPPSGDPHLKVSVFEELGFSGHAHASTTNVSGLHQNMVSSGNNNNNNLTNASTEHGGGGGGGLGGTVNYSNVAERVTNGKVQYSASSSDFRGEKGTDQCTVSARSEGMVESWINCSSDN